MQAPAVTQDWFDKSRERGLTTLKTISKLNAVNCRKNFSLTIPKGLLESSESEDYNAYLMILNHKNRYKYLGFKIEEVNGRLKIVKRPEFIWTGYVKFDGTWYAVTAQDIIKGYVLKTSKVIPPEMEFTEGGS